MEPSFISVEELAEQPEATLTRVDNRELVVIGSPGRERAVLLESTDYRLLRALAACAGGSEFDSETVSASDVAAIGSFLAEEISLGRTAELLNIARLDLQERFHRLGIPLRIGPASLEEARAEIDAAPRHR